MEWQFPILIAIGVGSLAAFLILGVIKRPKPEPSLEVQEYGGVRTAPGEAADSETIRRFSEAIDSLT